MKKQLIMSHDLMPLVKELIEQDQEVLLTVSGTSMNPFFSDQKTVVKLAKIKRNLKRFDVVLYIDQNTYKLHRILRVKKDHYIICGDALRTLEFIKKDQMIGLVIEHTKLGKTISSQSLRYRFKVSIWSLLRPFRGLLIRMFRR